MLCNGGGRTCDTSRYSKDVSTDGECGGSKAYGSPKVLTPSHISSDAVQPLQRYYTFSCFSSTKLYHLSPSLTDDVHIL